MRLVERLGRSGTAAGVIVEAGARAADLRDVDAIVARLHDRIIDRLDMAQVARLERGALRARLAVVVGEVVAAERVEVSALEHDAIAQRILNELVGLGPLEPLLADPSVSDVLVNGFEQVWVERDGKLELTAVRFRDDAHLVHTIRRIVARIGRRIDESSPMVDARLPDGSRVNAIVPPLALDGPSLSIRRFGARPLSAADLVKNGTLSPPMLDYLRTAVRARCSILVAGGTGAGKTTLLNALSSFIPGGERIITIEDAAELQLQQKHVVRLESRPPNLEKQGQVTIHDLVRNALRMRPDRIVVGEVRGSEVLDMLQAMNTGHEGSLTTVHANTARDAVSRLMTLLGMSGTTFSQDTMAQLIARAIHIIVHVTRYADGRRRISSIVEVGEQHGPTVELLEVFAFQSSGAGDNGAVQGRFLVRAPTRLGDRFLAAQPAPVAG